MASMSVRMSYPQMRALPDVGGKSPVRMDLQAVSTLAFGSGPGEENVKVRHLVPKYPHLDKRKTEKKL